MMVTLKYLKPNPWRDFGVDPIVHSVVDRFCSQVYSADFLDSVLIRPINSHYQIASGLHRVLAMLKCGIERADLKCRRMSSRAMLTEYARENAIQRTNIEVALAGSVAGALRYLQTIGYGRDQVSPKKVYDLLTDVPGMSYSIVSRHYAQLDHSGWITKLFIQKG